MRVTCASWPGRFAIAAIVLAALAGCGGKTRSTIGGTVTGLTGTMVLQNNGGDDLSVSANGPFTFATKVGYNGFYSVTVKTQPAGQSCKVTNGTGTTVVNVREVVVTCTNVYTIGGNVTGLTGTLVLQNNAADNLSLTASGPFTFPTRIAKGSAYAVTVKTQPTGQTCAVTNGSGTANANVTNVAVACATSSGPFAVGGTISGLKAAGLKLEVSAANSVSPASGATTFTLPTALAAGTEFRVGITAQPTGQTCVITTSHGVISTNVTNVPVACIDNVTDPIVGTYRAQITGSLVYITLWADGTYLYASVENNAPCGQNNGNGVEYGVYNYNKTSGAFSIKSAAVDTNGKCGLYDSGAARPLASGTLAKTGTGQSTVLTLTTTAGQVVLTPVPSTASSIVGSFGTPAHQNVWLFLDNGVSKNYLIAETQADTASGGQTAGVEYACYSIATGSITADLSAACQTPDAPTPNGPVDTSGKAGFSSAAAPIPYSIVDANTIQVGGATGTTATRITPN